MYTIRNLIPIYTTRGDIGAYLGYPYLYNPRGEWIGWIMPDRRIYSVRGAYVGWLSKEARVLRKLSETYDYPRIQPPQQPERVNPPATSPLPPMMPELPYGVIDVLQDRPELLPCVDFGDLRQDLD